jgi:MULE transposase domain
MPLLDIIGVDGMDKTFTVALCWLDQETEDNYQYAMNHLRALLDPQLFPAVVATDCEEALMSALSKTFPSDRTKTVLCFWHVAKNVLYHNKKRFETAERWEDFLRDFKTVVYSKTIEEFEENIEAWKTEYNWNDGNIHTSPADGPPDLVAEMNLERDAVGCCLGSWLGRYKEKVVHAWTDQYITCGVSTTSRYVVLIINKGLIVNVVLLGSRAPTQYSRGGLAGLRST